MHATLTLFGHTLTINVGIDCPNHGDPERDSALDALVETTGPHPDAVSYTHLRAHET